MTEAEENLAEPITEATEELKPKEVDENDSESAEASKPAKVVAAPAGPDMDSIAKRQAMPEQSLAESSDKLDMLKTPSKQKLKM